MALIVIAEDQAHIRNVLTMWMSRNGHEVLNAPNGRIALDTLKCHPAELLITDVNMPEMDGIELTAQAFDACPTLQRVFVVTSRCDQHEILTKLADPRVSVFPKPFSPSQLLREVEKVAHPNCPDRDKQTPSRPPASHSTLAGDH
ncbi:MAG: response regulator [Planctomycetota bacterium]